MRGLVLLKWYKNNSRIVFFPSAAGAKIFYCNRRFSSASVLVLELIQLYTDHQVRKVKPHVLLGLSGVGGIFNEEVRINNS